MPRRLFAGSINLFTAERVNDEVPDPVDTAPPPGTPTGFCPCGTALESVAAPVAGRYCSDDCVPSHGISYHVGGPRWRPELVDQPEGDLVRINGWPWDGFTLSVLVDAEQQLSTDPETAQDQVVKVEIRLDDGHRFVGLPRWIPAWLTADENQLRAEAETYAPRLQSRLSNQADLMPGPGPVDPVLRPAPIDPSPWLPEPIEATSLSDFLVEVPTTMNVPARMVIRDRSGRAGLLPTMRAQGADIPEARPGWSVYERLMVAVPSQDAAWFVVHDMTTGDVFPVGYVFYRPPWRSAASLLELGSFRLACRDLNPFVSSIRAIVDAPMSGGYYSAELRDDLCELFYGPGAQERASRAIEVIGVVRELLQRRNP